MFLGDDEMPGQFPSELIDRIRDSNDIVSVISEYVSLKKVGNCFTGLCPFHAGEDAFVQRFKGQTAFLLFWMPRCRKRVHVLAEDREHKLH